MDRAFGLLAVIASCAGLACGARTGLLVPPPDAGLLAVSGKVDLLFMIDNSGSMGDKQELLRQAIPDLIDRLLNPKCIDDQGNILADSQNGACTVGTLEFKPVPDIHIGIVTSSLGGVGANECPDDATNPLNPQLNRHDNDQGHLINRTANADMPLTDAEPASFLAWFPTVDANRGNPAPPVPAIADAGTLVSDFQNLVSGVGQLGCGIEAQLESWYRFLVQPDPYMTVTVDSSNIAHLQGVDDELLMQRHDFLRPDSLLAVIVVSDEDDSQLDPLSIGGTGWFYVNGPFPSPTGAPPKPTSVCATSPLDPACQPCTSAPSDPNCAQPFYQQNETSSINVRMLHMRQQYGVDAQFPIQRYIDGLTSPTVPNRNGEHPNSSSPYVGQKNCTNPIFAKTLPTSSSQELCQLEAGSRSPNLVFYSVITGVPHQLLQQDPTNPDSPQKNQLTSADWLSILGNDPLSYDFTGQDPHMLESETPRPGLPPIDAGNDADPIIGREWVTNMAFAEYACTFDLAQPHDCTDPAFSFGCDCPQGDMAPPPVCDLTVPTLQIKAKAYPGIRELVVAKSLGKQATVSSLCPIHTAATSQDDPLYGYRPAVAGLVEAFRAGLVH